jgi:hypothetical protein
MKIQYAKTYFAYQNTSVKIIPTLNLINLLGHNKMLECSLLLQILPLAYTDAIRSERRVFLYNLFALPTNSILPITLLTISNKFTDKSYFFLPNLRFINGACL